MGETTRSAELLTLEVKARVGTVERA